MNRNEGRFSEKLLSIVINKKLVRTGVTVIMAVSMAVPAYAGDTSSGTVVAGEGALAAQGGPGAYQWKQDEKGWLYQDFQGNYLKGQWKELRGEWYYFGGDGYMLENTWVDTDGKRYWVGDGGRMLKGQTVTVNGIGYELDGDGALVAPVKTEDELLAEATAADIVRSITNDGMGKRQKAEVIYNYVRGHMKYSHAGPRPATGDSMDAAAALYGFRRHTGNCYEYYAMSRYMLEAAGMPSVRVTRASDQDHYWNLVNVDGSWYHFDATPRRTGGRWCLLTTGQLRNSWSAHNYNVSAYPATP